MCLFKFLADNKEPILSLSERRVFALAALRPVSGKLKMGLPLFFDQLVSVLAKNKSEVSFNDEQEILATAGVNGKEFLRLGYTLSHVVHAYGAICQGITEYASIMKAPVTNMEFHNLNRCLDIAIAGAVTEFETVRNLETKGREVESFGSLAHELRNALNRAIVSSEMIAKGVVGIGGSTGKVLQYSLAEMNQLITRALSELRLRADSEAVDELFLVNEVVSQLVVTAEVEAASRGLTLSVHIEEGISVKVDRHLLLSALGNLVQNAMKFTKEGTGVKLTVRAEDQFAVIEVSDHCGGIPEDKIEAIFAPFVQHSKDRSGLGLGLLISRQAIEKCHGTLSAHNAGDGCVFRISIPLATVEDLSPSVV